MSGLNVQDDVGIQYANNYRRILNGYGYEFDPYGDVKPCGTLDYNGDVGGQTLCGVLVWLQNRNDNGGTGDDHGSDKIQSEHCCRNLDGNSDGALQTGNEIDHDGEDEDLNEKIVGDVCLCKESVCQNHDQWSFLDHPQNACEHPDKSDDDDLQKPDGNNDDEHQDKKHGAVH
ncbi:uncharacterized [Tachysurus ichikawai]